MPMFMHLARVQLTHAFPPTKIIISRIFFCEVTYNFVRRLSLNMIIILYKNA